jgi:hypothetical protein
MFKVIIAPAPQAQLGNIDEAPERYLRGDARED